MTRYPPRGAEVGKGLLDPHKAIERCSQLLQPQVRRRFRYVLGRSRDDSIATSLYTAFARKPRAMGRTFVSLTVGFAAASADPQCECRSWPTSDSQNQACRSLAPRR